MNLLFVSFDNSSTLTISDLSLFHSFSHQIYPQNRLNLSFLLPLCSSTQAFVVREVDIMAFLMLTIQVKVLFLGPKDLCQECDIHQRLHSIFKTWHLFYST